MKTRGWVHLWRENGLPWGEEGSRARRGPDGSRGRCGAVTVIRDPESPDIGRRPVAGRGPQTRLLL